MGEAKGVEAEMALVEVEVREVARAVVKEVVREMAIVAVVMEEVAYEAVREVVDCKSTRNET